VTRALVIDDEHQISRAVRRCLEGDGLEVEAAGTGSEALALAAANPPDIAIVDLGLPDLRGIDLIRQLRSWSQLPIIVLSGAGSEATKVEALQAGADDYVTKPFGLDELRARVQAVLRRASPEPDHLTLAFGDLELDLAARSVRRHGEAVHLTPTEYALLQALVEHPGKLLTHWWLLDKVWGRGVGDEGRQYLRVYVGQLRTKLGDDARTPTYISTEPGIGYRWIAEPRMSI
jgi:two-component system, OmpR family, KDP operon response regulator KdpE